MTDIETTAEHIYNRDQLLKTYAMLNVNSATAKVLMAEVDRISTIIDATLADRAAGRFIPAGGMALTAEQVEDVRQALDELASARDECDTWDLYDRLRALFPATAPAEEFKPSQSIDEAVTRVWKAFTPTPAEPAEVNGNICTERNSSTLVDEGRESGGRMDRYTCIPAPAEPAEEETKAQRCPSEIEGWGCSLTNGHDGDHTAHDQDGPAYTWPASSPVVPAPTETGPWPSWDRIQTKNVERILRLVSYNSNFHRVFREQARIAAESLAPFVAAEEG